MRTAGAYGLWMLLLKDGREPQGAHSCLHPGKARTEAAWSLHCLSICTDHHELRALALEAPLHNPGGICLPGSLSSAPQGS